MNLKINAWLTLVVAVICMIALPPAWAAEPVDARANAASVRERNVFLALFLAVAFWSNREDEARHSVAPRERRDHDPAPAPDPNRKISEQDCTQPIEFDGGNLRCK